MQPDPGEWVTEVRYQPTRSYPVRNLYPSVCMLLGFGKFVPLEEYPAAGAARNDLGARQADLRRKFYDRTAVIERLIEPARIGRYAISIDSSPCPRHSVTQRSAYSRACWSRPPM